MSEKFLPFLDFSIDFISKYNFIETKRLCTTALKDESYDIKKVNDDCIVATRKNSNILFFDSFSPFVKIVFRSVNDETSVSVNFKLRVVVKVLMSIFALIAFAFEICLIGLYFKGSLVSLFILLLPALLAVYAWIMPYLGFRVVSNST